MEEVQVIRSNRKTFALEVTERGVVVRAPRHAAKKDIERLLEQHRVWIEKAKRRFAETRSAADGLEPLTPDAIAELTARAKEVIAQRVAFFAPLVGVTYGTITIRHQRSKWGSCSAKGNLNFNCLLMLAPPEVLDSVVVHELCHRKEMNHSAAFYREVYRVMPDYDQHHTWLKKNGSVLLQRMLAGEKKTG